MADPVQTDARAARLAAALRANIARRKARDRATPDSDSAASDKPLSYSPETR